jgi:diguanylate cyclase (GGDEF)-like protein
MRAKEITMQSDRRRLLYSRSYIKFSSYSLLAAALVHELFLVFFFYFGVYPMVVFNTFSVSIYAYCLKILNVSVVRINTVLIGWLVYLEILLHAVFASYYVGTGSGFHYYIILLSALPFLTFGDSKSIRAGKLVAIVIAFTILDTLLFKHAPPYILGESHRLILKTFNTVIFITSAVLVSLFYSMISYEIRMKLEHTSSTDELTGLYNRRLFSHLAEIELKEMQRNYSALSIIMLDIDNFKTINDKFGHKCGDQALLNVSSILRQTVRPKDILSRWGGEEFIILLPETDIAHAEMVADRLRNNIENLKMACQDNEFSMTVTLGLVSSHTHNVSLDKLIEQADSAMYAGKAKGKNRYVIAS